jgi:hypothetical protein
MQEESLTLTTSGQHVMHLIQQVAEMQLALKALNNLMIHTIHINGGW